MDDKFTVFVKIPTMGVIFGAYVTFVFTIVYAWWVGDFVLVMRFNDYHEGYFELLISVLSLPFAVYLFHDIVKGW
jgi:hypothetical protein